MFADFRTSYRERAQQGAVSIEAIGFSLVLIMALTLIILIGSAYWNLTMLNTSASSASLAAQALINTDCSAARPNAACTARAQNVVSSITNDFQNGLIFVDPASVRVTQQLSAPTRAARAYPGEIGGVIPACWGYSFVSLQAKFKPLGGATVPVRGASMATGYQPIC
jgi:hypothetical protein